MIDSDLFTSFPLRHRMWKKGFDRKLWHAMSCVLLNFPSVYSILLTFTLCRLTMLCLPFQMKTRHQISRWNSPNASFRPRSFTVASGAINSSHLWLSIESKKAQQTSINWGEAPVEAENWCYPISIKRKQRAIKLNSFNYSSCRSRLFEFIWEHKFPSWSFFHRALSAPLPHHHSAQCMFTWYLIACYLNKLVYFPFNRKIKTFLILSLPRRYSASLPRSSCGTFFELHGESNFSRIWNWRIICIN